MSGCSVDFEEVYRKVASMPGVVLAVMGLDGYPVFWSSDIRSADEVLQRVYGFLRSDGVAVELYRNLLLIGFRCGRFALAVVAVNFDAMVALLRSLYGIAIGSPVRCARCGYDLSFEKHRCPRCGREVPFTADRCPFCGEAIVVKKCPRCGAKVTSDGRLYVSRRFRFFK